jgi:hypothetical protein
MRGDDIHQRLIGGYSANCEIVDEILVLQANATFEQSVKVEKTGKTKTASGK